MKNKIVFLARTMRAIVRAILRARARMPMGELVLALGLALLPACWGWGDDTGGDDDSADDDTTAADDDATPACDDSDADGDGYSECDGDCNDADPEINPDAHFPGLGGPETCYDGVDNDCDGMIDEGCPAAPPPDNPAPGPEVEST